MAFAVQTAVQNGIENLSGSSINGNSHPGDAYRFQARTAEELKATQHLVPTVKIEDLPPDEVEPAPAPPPPKANKGWIF